MLLLLLGLALAQSAPAPASGAALPTGEVFLRGKDTLTQTGKQQLKQWAGLVKANPGWVFEVGVHTSSQGSDAYNKSLSQQRADRVRDALIKAGVSRKLLVATGYGEERPMASNRDAEGRSQNQRLELRKLHKVGAKPPAPSNRTAAVTPAPVGNRQAKQSRWIGYSPELIGMLSSGDEERDGKLQIDTVQFEVPFSGTFDLRFYHTRNNAPTGALIGPSGQRIALTPGDNTVQLSKGRWTAQATDHKKAEETWGMRLHGISSEAKPGPDADACTVISYLVAQAHVKMRGARGQPIDQNFHTAPAIPGLPGVATIHSTDEYWLKLYEGTDAAASSASWQAAREAVQRCTSSAWTSDLEDWRAVSYKFRPEDTWQERELTVSQPAQGKTMLFKLNEKHKGGKAEATLYLYRTKE